MIEWKIVKAYAGAIQRHEFLSFLFLNKKKKEKDHECYNFRKSQTEIRNLKWFIPSP